MSEVKEVKQLGLVARILKNQEEPDAVSVSKFVSLVIRDLNTQISAEESKLILLKEVNKTEIENLKLQIEDALTFEEEAYANVPKNVLINNAEMLKYIGKYTQRISERAEELSNLETKLVKEKAEFEANSLKINNKIKSLKAAIARCK